MNMGFEGRVAIVAASSQGIGLATAEAFAAEGCRVAMCARNPGRLEAAAEKIRKQTGAQVLARPLDVTEQDDARLVRGVFGVMQVGFVKQQILAVLPAIFVAVDKDSALAG